MSRPSRLIAALAALQEDGRVRSWFRDVDPFTEGADRWHIQPADPKALTVTLSTSEAEAYVLGVRHGVASP